MHNLEGKIPNNGGGALIMGLACDTTQIELDGLEKGDLKIGGYGGG